MRVFFSSVILFLSLHLMSNYKNSAWGDHRNAAVTVKDWDCDSHIVTFFLRDYSLMPHVKVLVNGEVRGVFNNRYVTVAVREGDRIDIDGTFYERPINIEVLDVSRGINNPPKGSVFTLKGTVVSLHVGAT
jgi:hypothetical protein